MQLYMKTQDENTLGEQRIKRIENGAMINASLSPGAQAAAVGVSNINLAHRRGIISDARLINNMPMPELGRDVGIHALMSGFDVPLNEAKDTLNTLIKEGRLSNVANALYGKNLSATANSLPPEWQTLWDANRIDLTIRKVTRPTVRGLIYNETNTPLASQTMNLTEFYPHGIVFEENNGKGQSVRRGDLRAGEADTATQRIYAASLIVDLLATLFNNTYTDSSVNDAVAIGENGLKDDLALNPIFAHTYVAAAKTAANTGGSTREQNLYRTMQDGFEELGERRDPITGRKLGATGLIILANPLDAQRIQSVLGGRFPAANSDGPFLSLESSVSRIIGYDPETIVTESETVTYNAVPTGIVYVIKPNRRMAIAKKRDLQLNVNMNPNPGTLAQEDKAWWFCEAIFNKGIDDFIQEVTLPAWT